LTIFQVPATIKEIDNIKHTVTISSQDPVAPGSEQTSPSTEEYVQQLVNVVDKHSFCQLGLQQAPNLSPDVENDPTPVDEEIIISSPCDYNDVADTLSDLSNSPEPTTQGSSNCKPNQLEPDVAVVSRKLNFGAGATD
jgi:hypothetical protein